MISLQSYLSPLDYQSAKAEKLIRQIQHPPMLQHTFADWLPAVTPNYRWDWPHLRHVREQLDRITRGEIKRLAIFMPPRHGKSEMTTIRYAAYRLECDPAMRVILGAYNQRLAERFSRRSRAIVRQRVGLSRERATAAEWETTAGGGLRAVGVGGGITGQGGNLIIMDDPVKSREEAESQVYRDRVYDWYTDDLYTRLEPGGAIIFIMTRWHGDDLAGRILASDTAADWTTVSLPAEAEENDPLGRLPGAALCPDRYDLPALLDLRKTLGRSYYALYQQRPQPREGSQFKLQWFPLVDVVPANARRIRWWDKAATQDDGNYTAGVLMAEADGIYYIEDVVRGQWSSGERDKIIKQTADLDALKYDTQVTYWGPQDPGAAGKDAAAAFIRLLAGYPVHTEIESGSKEVRAEPLASQAQAGNVRVKRGEWTSAYISEMCDFPTGKYDDQVDGSSGAFNKLAAGAGSGQAGPNPLGDYRG